MNSEIHTNNSDKDQLQQTNTGNKLCVHSWSSMYNNIHPIRRLPSITISIILTSFIFFTGFVNTKNTGKNIISKPNTLNNLHNKAIFPLTKGSFSDGDVNQKTFMQITILSNN